jgi:hypothetical protein
MNQPINNGFAVHQVHWDVPYSICFEKVLGPAC